MKSGDVTGLNSNPFASGLGSQLFGGVSAAVPDHETAKESVDRDNEDEEDEDADVDDDDAASTSSAESLVTALASTSIGSPSPWASAPAYDALYLSTMQEYLPPSVIAKQATSMPNDNKTDDIDEGDAQKSSGWALEAYESSHAVDAAFDRFSQRVSHQPEQCVRYDLRGAPLLFSAGPLLDALYPPPPDPAAGMVTRAQFVSTTAANMKRVYAPLEGTIKPCPACGGKRVFECQLVPNLINVLSKKNEKIAKSGKKETEEERKKAVERAIKGLDNDRGMEWGTCMIFSCDRDCCLEEAEGDEAKGCWREEFILVQWDE
jgi:pre-rRNA-processing protein TSR4